MTASDLKPDSPKQAARPRRRWYQFTLRTAGVWIALFCLLLGSFAWWRDRAERQRKVVEELRGLGAKVEYQYWYLTDREKTDGLDWAEYRIAEPDQEFFLFAWLRSQVGDDYVSRVDQIQLTLSPETTTQSFQLLQNFRSLGRLNLDGSAVSGDDLKSLPFFDTLEGFSLIPGQGSDSLLHGWGRDDTRGVLTDGDLSVFDRAYRLRFLSLQNQSIGEDGVKHLRDCHRLQVLRLGGSSIGDEGLRQLNELTELAELELDQTSITDNGLEHLSRLDRLQRLSLMGNRLSGEGLASIGPKQQLDWLDVSNTNITDDSLRHMQQFPRLHILRLDYSRISGTGLKHLAGIKRIGEINLAGCPVTDESISKIDLPENIYAVFLNGCSITDQGISELKLPLDVTSISLANTSISDDSLEHLQKKGYLRRLDVKNTRITPDGVKRFKAKLPDCEVID